MSRTHMSRAAVVGAGPAGLIAAERLATAGVGVTVYDRMPSVGRKFLLAGRGGLNLTHSEPLEPFLARYGAARAWLAPLVARLPAGGAPRLGRGPRPGHVRGQLGPGLSARHEGLTAAAGVAAAAGRAGRG